MQCLKCGKDAVLYVNAHDVHDNGGCTIECTECGQPHAGNLCFGADVVSIPLTFKQNVLIYGCIVAALVATYGIYEVVIMLLF